MVEHSPEFLASEDKATVIMVVGVLVVMAKHDMCKGSSEVCPSCRLSLFLLFTRVLMALSSQTRIVGKVDGQFLHARWWL